MKKLVPIDDLYLVEWSNEQQCFHVDKTKKILRNNIYALLRNRHADFFTVAISDSYEEAKAMAKLLERERNRCLDIQELPLQ
jgi:hypothetical protein